MLSMISFHTVDASSLNCFKKRLNKLGVQGLVSSWTSPLNPRLCPILGLVMWCDDLKTRPHKVSKHKCTKFDLRCGSAPDPAGGAYSAPPETLAVPLPKNPTPVLESLPASTPLFSRIFLSQPWHVCSGSYAESPPTLSQAASAVLPSPRRSPWLHFPSKHLQAIRQHSRANLRGRRPRYI